MGVNKKVKTIPASINRFTAVPASSTKKRRVAGYARVSTDHEDQVTSYAAQVDYYTSYINGRDDWEFAGIYTDEGISATNTRHREGFKQMVADALAGKIDLVITKSVSRFARNTVDSLTTVRKLKEKGIEVYFEKENIWTLDSKGELLITIMSSLAQEESRSISENTTWGHRKRFADGKVSFAYSRFLGYDKGTDGSIVVNEAEAETVRKIYRLFLNGLSFHSIAAELTRQHLRTPGGKYRWNQSTVRSILTNEKYKGDALLQKSFTVDFLTKKKKPNEGEVPQYYVENSHPAIIKPETFDLVQAEIARRARGKSRYSGVGIFSSRIKCAECGSWYGSKVWHSNDKYRRVIYQCNHKFDGEKKCSTPHLTEDEIKAAFAAAYNRFLAGQDEIIRNTETVIGQLSDSSGLETEREKLEQEMAVLAEMVQNCVAENARTAMDQGKYQERYSGLAGRYETLKEKHDKVSEEIAARTARSQVLARFLETLKKNGVVEEFDEVLWGDMVEHVTVDCKKKMVFTFKNGVEVTI
ncbi:MAG: recombinase family protein [Hungatella sp.]|nr:recombinase family protein [Hungatella sp.]